MCTSPMYKTYTVIIYIECIIKIRINFNLNFPLYCVSAKGCCVRENLTLLVNSHILKMAAMLNLSAEYNRRTAIIEGLRVGRSATKIIRFFGYPRSTFMTFVAKYTVLEQSNEGASEEESFERMSPQSLKGLNFD